GTHVNVSGAGVVATAPNADEAVAFLEYLVSDDAQRLFAEGNNEYPVVAGIDVDSPINDLGPFKEDTVNAGELGPLNPVAVRVFDRAGWE
ncbi:MAG: ABC transporter substrate-binding protein, partial [Pseudomonadota bacterium]